RDQLSLMSIVDRLRALSSAGVVRSWSVVSSHHTWRAHACQPRSAGGRRGSGPGAWGGRGPRPPRERSGLVLLVKPAGLGPSTRRKRSGVRENNELAPRLAVSRPRVADAVRPRGGAYSIRSEIPTWGDG